MSEDKKEIRPFFIAALEKISDDSLRPCDVSSAHVCAIRPLYNTKKETPSADKTRLIIMRGDSTGTMEVHVPYPVVRQIFADHGYEFVDNDAVMQAARKYQVAKPTPR